MNVKHYIKNRTLLFEITEELDHHEAEKLRKRTDYEIQRLMPKKVIFDFTNVKFMDSAGIGLIIGRYKQIKSIGGKMELINVNEKIKKIFEMSGILKIINIVSV